MRLLALALATTLAAPAMAQEGLSAASATVSVAGSAAVAFSPVMIVGVTASTALKFSEAVSLAMAHPHWTVVEVQPGPTVQGQEQVLAKIKSSNDATTLIVPVTVQAKDRAGLAVGDRIKADTSKRTVTFTKGETIIALVPDPAVATRATIRKD